MNHDLISQGIMLIISSPSGVGKTTISNLLINKEDNYLVNSVSVTTRYKRLEEIEGKDYFFVSEEKFLEMCKCGEMLEYAKVFKNYYGVPRKYVEDNINKGINVLFNIDWQGAFYLMKIMKKYVVSIFILPPSMKELEKRLINRGTDDHEIIKNRLNHAAFEMSHCYEYDYVIINKCIDESVDKISGILKTEMLKVKRQVNLCNFIEHISN